MNAREALDSYIEALQVLAHARQTNRSSKKRKTDAQHRAQLIDAYAHELAAQQRATGRDTYCSGANCCQEHGGVADLIDPKAQRASTEGDTP